MQTGSVAGYVALYESGELSERTKQAYARLTACDICPRCCGVNRRESTKGAGCHTGEMAWVSSHQAHFGEESPLVGMHGSGTIFFTHCNLRCQYCQNYDISQQGRGQEVEPEEIAVMMLELQGAGCALAMLSPRF